MPATPIDVPNLRAGETAYRLPSGDLVTVRITRLPPGPQPEYVHLRCDGHAIDAAGTPTGAELPASTHGLHLGAFGPHGHTTLEEELARITAYALAAWLPHVGLHAAIRALPLAEEASIASA